MLDWIGLDWMGVENCDCDGVGDDFFGGRGVKRKIMRLSYGIFEPAGYFWCSARARLSKYLSFQK